MLADSIAHISAIKRKVHDYGKPIYITISGAHLYGFPSPNSDFDYRGSYLVKTESILGLDNIKDEISFVSLDDSNLDVVLYEMKKEIGLLLNSNCNVLEHLYSPPLYTTTEHSTLKDLTRNIITKTGLYNSYRGMAYFNYKKFILGNQPTYKKYLYVFRALLAGIYALENGRIEPNINVLREFYQVPDLDELIEAKINGLETERVGRILKYDEIIDDLFYAIDTTYDKSKLPEKYDINDRFKLDHFLRDIRKKYVG